jgi:hypothetical protein
MFKFYDESLPFYCSIEDLAVDEGGGGAPPPVGGEGDKETPKPSVRDQLEKGFEADRKASEPGRKPRRVAGGAEIDEGAPGEARGDKTGDKTLREGSQTQVAPPEAFAKEVKAEWANVPPTVQAAIIKREQDMAKGVEELKSKQAEIDKVIAPHMEAIRRNGHTPAKAVEQLFAWFQALAANPKEAFPALAKSYNFDLGSLVQPKQETPVNGQAPPAQGAEIPDPVKNYITGLEKRITDLTAAVTDKIGSLETNWQRDSETKTNEILMNWAKDKPHFEAVRKHMGYLIGSGAVPLKQDGKIDLDKAYDMAIFALPEVREQVLTAKRAEEQKEAEAKAAAEKKAQAEAAAKARAAGVGVGTGAPGAPGQPGQGRQRAKSKTVRDSLKEAFENARE